ASVGSFISGLVCGDGTLSLAEGVEYRQIDHLPSPDAAIPGPDALTSALPDTADAASPLSPAGGDALRAAIHALNLPDLDGWLAEYRAARLAVQREELE